MLPDNSDLLHQLSGELGLSDLLDDVQMLEEEHHTGPSFYEQLLGDDAGPLQQSTTSDTAAFFGDVVSSENGKAFLLILAGNRNKFWISTGLAQGDGFQQMSMPNFPPSPSNSDSSSTMSQGTDSSRDGGHTLQNGSDVNRAAFTPPISPPGSTSFVTSMPGGSVVSISDLNNVKLPIPKISRPSKWASQVK